MERGIAATGVTRAGTRAPCAAGSGQVVAIRRTAGSMMSALISHQA